jgi:protein ImuA
MLRCPMPIPLLSPSGDKSRPAQTLLGPLTLLRGRVHEFCGSARQMLAVLVLRECTGPVIWVHPGWQAERLFPDGLRDHADPGRLIFATARRPEDLLWSMEEVLRSGAVPLVVAELPGPPALTPVRRLNLAAEAGAEAARGAGRAAPLGLMLTPGDGGAAGVESRWRMQPRHAAGLTCWQLSRLRARAEPPKDWRVLQDGRGRLRLAAAEAPQPAPV